MSIFGMFQHKSKNGTIYYLHMKKKGNRVLYYFSKDPVDALPTLPLGYEVIENPRTGLPMLKKKRVPGLLDAVSRVKMGSKK